LALGELQAPPFQTVTAWQTQTVTARQVAVALVSLEELPFQTAKRSVGRLNWDSTETKGPSKTDPQQASLGWASWVDRMGSLEHQQQRRKTNKPSLRQR
jgi:hypothetical protein